jgi:RNA recognition motif-containing protein
MSVCIKNTFVTLVDASTMSLRKSTTLPELDLSYLEPECLKPEVESVADIDTDIESDVESLPSATSSFESVRVSIDEICENKTTVMIRNIPCKYTQPQMVAEISRVNSNFNFVYVPPARTVKVKKNLGYSFVNFNTAQDATQFMIEFAGHNFSLYKNSPKTAIVNYADCQGLEENMKFFKKSKVSKSKFRPYVVA